jgi:hypothetical protein
MPKRRDLLEEISESDPNYEVSKRFYLEAWADSNGLVADAHAGGVSLSDYVEGNANTVSQAMRTLVAIEDGTPIPAKCREIDGMAKKSIRLFSKALLQQSKRLGETNVKIAIGKFSDRVTEISARSKQRILKAALDRKARRKVSSTEPSANARQRRLGVRLKQLKSESNLTWNTIAKESGISYRWLLDIAGGRTPSVDTRKTIQKYFSKVLQRRIRF